MGWIALAFLFAALGMTIAGMTDSISWPTSVKFGLYSAATYFLGLSSRDTYKP